MGGGTDGRYEPGLDGIRALAVLAVLAFHDGRLAGGFLGVSTFFTLSGFLITRLLVREFGRTTHVSLRNFFGRRIRRLFPAVVAGVLLAAVVTIALHDAQTSLNFSGDGLAALGNVANWRFLASGQSYANLFATPSPLQPFWSLAVEEQFYLVLAPLIVGLLVLARGRRGVVLAVLATLGVLSFADGWMLAPHSADRAYYGTDTRALEFLVGAVLAVALSGRVIRRGAARALAVAGPFALIAMVWANAHARVGEVGLFRGGLLVYAVLGGVLLLAACQPGPVRSACAGPPLRGLGRISYGVYVYHWPIFLWLTAARTGLSPLPLTGVRLALTLGLAIMSFHWLERPIREQRVFTNWRRWVAFGTAIAGAFGVALLVGAVAAAPPITFAATVAPSSVLAASQRALASTPPVSAGNAASTDPMPRVRRVLVVGDSVALTLGRGVERWGAAHGVFVWNGGALGCSLLEGADVRGNWGVAYQPADRCHTRENWPKVLTEFRPDVIVVLYGAWDHYDLSFDYGAAWYSPGDPQWDAFYRQAVVDTARQLSLTGAHQLWLAPPCYAAIPGASDTGAGWYDPSRVDVLGRIDRSVAAATPHMTVSPVAHEMGCPVDFNARPDGTHYDDAGADAVATRLGPGILRLG
jgi:peptidoglycan/LPS O-acetylase OafA/YrhL